MLDETNGSMPSGILFVVDGTWERRRDIAIVPIAALALECPLCNFVINEVTIVNETVSVVMLQSVTLGNLWVQDVTIDNPPQLGRLRNASSPHHRFQRRGERRRLPQT